MEALEAVEAARVEILDTAEETAAAMEVMGPPLLRSAMEAQVREELPGPGEVRPVRYIPEAAEAAATRLLQRKPGQAEVLAGAAPVEQEMNPETLSETESPERQIPEAVEAAAPARNIAAVIRLVLALPAVPALY